MNIYIYIYIERERERWFGLVWFVCLMAYQPLEVNNAKAIPLEEQSWYYLTHSWEDKGVHTFPKGICLKVNIIARLEYELTYYDLTITSQGHPERERERERDFLGIHIYIYIYIYI